jgi:hypothetical protein
MLNILNKKQNIMTTTDKLKLTCGAFDRDAIDLNEIQNDFDGVHIFEYENDYGKFCVEIGTYEYYDEYPPGYVADLSYVNVFDAMFYNEYEELIPATDDEENQMTDIILQNF